MGIGEARGKLLLFGEHAAVYGAPAVGCALPWGVRAALLPGSEWTLPGLGPHEAAVQGLLVRLEALAAEEGLEAPVRGRLELSTELPLGSGFGSSGALCAALVNLFWGGLPLSDRDRLAWKAEAVFHGTPSGIDTALALRHGWWALDASTRPVGAAPLRDPGLVLVTGAVTREADTKTLVADLARRRTAEPLVREALTSLGDLSARAIEGLTRGTGLPPELISQARGHLQSLGLESAALTAVLDAGLDSGALAGKLSGAGGGGAFFLLFGDKPAAEAALPTVQKAIASPLWTAPPRLVSV